MANCKINRVLCFFGIRFRILILMLFISIFSFGIEVVSPIKHQPYKQIRGGQAIDSIKYSVFASIIDGDTIPEVYLPELTILPREIFHSKKQERVYWKLVKKVKKTYPLSRVVYYTLYETNEYIETLPNQKEKDDYLKLFQKELIKEYMPVLKHMTYSEGKILIKLIYRECSFSSYDLIKAYRGKFVAGLWQGIARLFTANLKKEYDPEHNKEDAMIERIIIRIQNGTL